MNNNLTTGSCFRILVRFSLPFLLSYFLQTLYGMADLFIIGQFCPVESTTAVSIGSQIMHMTTVMIVGLAMGTTVMIGHAAGAKDRKQINHCVGNTITIFAILSILVTCILLLLTKKLVAVMSTPGEAVLQTRQYLTICFIGIPFITAYNIISAVFRGMGDSRSPMYFIAVACAFNIGLDYLFIGYFEMGAAGAALGTTIAQTISVIISLIAICRKQMIPGLSKADLKPNGHLISELLKIGIPIALQDGFIQISFLVITIFANQRGLDDAAAVGIVEKLIGILFLVPSTMLSSVSALAAQNLGAGKGDRAKKTLYYAILINVCFGILAATAMQFMAEQAVSLFTDSAAVIVLGGQYMRSYVWDCIVAGIHFCFSGYFCACAMSNISFIHNVCSILLARIPIAYFMSKQYPETLYPMGWGAPAGSCISVLICVSAYIWLCRKKKKCSKIESVE